MAKITYPKARAAIEDALQGAGWTLVRGLKVPYATSPNGKLRLWFKAQAVYYTHIDNPWVDRHKYEHARTILYGLDIREEDPQNFAAWATRQSEKEDR